MTQSSSLFAFFINFFVLDSSLDLHQVFDMLAKSQFRELSVRHFQRYALCALRGGGNGARKKRGDGNVGASANANATSMQLSANFVLRDMASREEHE